MCSETSIILPRFYFEGLSFLYLELLRKAAASWPLFTQYDRKFWVLARNAVAEFKSMLKNNSPWTLSASLDVCINFALYLHVQCNAIVMLSKCNCCQWCGVSRMDVLDLQYFLIGNIHLNFIHLSHSRIGLPSKADNMKTCFEACAAHIGKPFLSNPQAEQEADTHVTWRSFAALWMRATPRHNKQTTSTECRNRASNSIKYLNAIKERGPQIYEWHFSNSCVPTSVNENGSNKPM